MYYFNLTKFFCIFSLILAVIFLNIIQTVNLWGLNDE